MPTQRQSRCAFRAEAVALSVQTGGEGPRGDVPWSCSAADLARRLATPPRLPEPGAAAAACPTCALTPLLLLQSVAALDILRYVLIPHPAALEVPELVGSVLDVRTLQVKGTSGDLPLHVACAIQPAAAVVRELIAKDARALRVRNKYEDLPLHRACFNCSPEAAAILAQVTLLLLLSAAALMLPLVGVGSDSPGREGCSVVPRSHFTDRAARQLRTAPRVR